MPKCDVSPKCTFQNICTFCICFLGLPAEESTEEVKTERNIATHIELLSAVKFLYSLGLGLKQIIS